MKLCTTCARKAGLAVWLSDSEAEIHLGAHPKHKVIDGEERVMTNPVGENRMPPTFYGRRKHDPKPVYIERKMFDRESVGLIVLVVLVFAAVMLFGGCVSLSRYQVDVAAARLEQSVECWDSTEKIVRHYEQKLCEAQGKNR